MINWGKNIISWHAVYSSFQILIHYEYNNVRSSISRSNKHIPDSSNSPRQTLAPARGAGSPRWKHPLPARLLPTSPWPSALPACPPQASAQSPLLETLPDHTIRSCSHLPRWHLPGSEPPCVFCIGLWSPSLSTMRPVNKIIFTHFFFPHLPDQQKVRCQMFSVHLFLLSVPQTQ